MTDRQRRQQQHPSYADDSSSGNYDESLSSSADVPVATTNATSSTGRPRRSSQKKAINYAQDSNSEDEDEEEEEEEVVTKKKKQKKRVTKKKKAASSAGRKRKNDDDDDESDFRLMDIDDEESEEEKYDEDSDAPDEDDDDDASDIEDTGTTKKRKRAGGGDGRKKKQGVAKKATTAKSGGRVSVEGVAAAAASSSSTGEVVATAAKKKKKPKAMMYRAIFSTTNWVFYGANAILVYDNKWNTQPAREMIKQHIHQTRPIRCSRNIVNSRTGVTRRCENTPPISATVQIERRQQEQGESVKEKATFHNTTNKILDCIRLAAFADLVVFHEDSNFKQKLFDDLVQVTGKTTGLINYLFETIVDDSFGDNIGVKLLEDHVYSQEQIVQLKALLIELKNNPELEERLLKYSTDDYEKYTFGNNCEKHTQRKSTPPENPLIPDEEEKKEKQEKRRNRLLQKEEELRRLSTEGTVPCTKCERPFIPTETKDIGGQINRECGDCNLRHCINKEQRKRVQAEEKMNQLTACKVVKKTEIWNHRDGKCMNQHGFIEPRPANDTRLSQQEKENVNILCGCALASNCQRFDVGCSKFKDLIQVILETLQEMEQFGDKMKAGFDQNINFLKQVYPNEDLSYHKRMLAEKIAMAAFEYHHYGEFHPTGNTKSNDVSSISNEEDRNLEVQKCVLLFKPCHFWNHTLRERQIFSYITSRAVFEVVKGKEEIFKGPQEWKCKGVGYGDNDKRKCLLGLDKDDNVAVLMTKIGNTVYNNEANRHIDRESYKPINIFLRCFECNHKNNTKKECAWHEEKVDQIKKKMKENGEVVCFMCHWYISIVLGHTRYRKGKP